MGEYNVNMHCTTKAKDSKSEAAAALGRGAGKSGGLAHEARSAGGRAQGRVHAQGSGEGARSPGGARAHSGERARGQTAAGTPRIKSGNPKCSERAFYRKRHFC